MPGRCGWYVRSRVPYPGKSHSADPLGFGGRGPTVARHVEGQGYADSGHFGNDLQAAVYVVTHVAVGPALVEAGASFYRQQIQAVVGGVFLHNLLHLAGPAYPGCRSPGSRDAYPRGVEAGVSQ